MRWESERNLRVIELLLNSEPRLTQAEVAKQFGITRERVRQIVVKWEETTGRTMPIDKIPAEKKLKRDKLVFSGLLGKRSDQFLADIYQLSVGFVATLRKKQETPTWASQRPDHCEECETHPYSKGMCKNCYMRNLRKRNNAKI